MKGVQSQQTLAKDRLSSASLRLGGRTDGAQVLEGCDAPHATVQRALQVRSGQLAAAQQVRGYALENPEIYIYMPWISVAGSRGRESCVESA